MRSASDLDFTLSAIFIEKLILLTMVVEFLAELFNLFNLKMSIY